MSTSFDGGTIVLYVVASAVIGGTSMFGGRGHPLHPVLGGLVIAAIVNGMALLGLPAAIQLMATAIVLIASVLVDVLLRRRGRRPASHYGARGEAPRGPLITRLPGCSREWNY